MSIRHSPHLRARARKAGLALLVAAAAAGCTDPVQPETATAEEVAFATSDQACWGQATKVFAQTGQLGAHSANQPTPRLGLARLARALFEAGIISEPTMQALGAFVADELGLSIDACM